MSSPSEFAQLHTQTRVDVLHDAEGKRISEALHAAREERAAARVALNQLRAKADSMSRKAAERETLRQLYPQLPSEAQPDVGTYADLTDALTHAIALAAAAQVVYESVRLESVWFNQRVRNNRGPGGLAQVVHWNGRLVTAPSYLATLLLHDCRAPADPWIGVETHTLNAGQVRSLIGAWIDAPDGWVLSDPDGRLYIAKSGMQLELVPTHIAAPHTDTEALRAALQAYGFTAVSGREAGHTWLAVPLDPTTPMSQVYLGMHLRISTSPDAKRRASASDGVWSASVYDADGEYVTTLDAAPAGSTLAEDSAYCARVIANVRPAITPNPCRPANCAC